MAEGKHPDIEHGADIMRKAGFGTGLQLQPNRVLESVGTRLALEEEGFTTENAKNVVQKILNSEESEDRDRLKAADMVFKVTGAYASDQIAKEAVQNNVIFAKIEQHIYNFESELKKALGYENTRIIEAQDERDDGN